MIEEKKVRKKRGAARPLKFTNKRLEDYINNVLLEVTSEDGKKAIADILMTINGYSIVPKTATCKKCKYFEVTEFGHLICMNPKTISIGAVVEEHTACIFYK